ncbi:MAG: hypothetical protein U0790_11545 [Isosphaeraceae bacterium]
MRVLFPTIIVTLLVGTPASSAGRPVQEPSGDRPAGDGPATSRRDGALDMTRAVVCRSIDGFEKYEPLPGASLTQDEKLLIYYRPLNYKTVRESDRYRVHLVQDGQIRRRGEKGVLRRKLRILEYEPKSTEPPGVIFLRNSVPLKGLPPGDYEYDITLHDENNPGPPAVQTVEFRIVLPELPKARGGKPPGRRSEGSRTSDPAAVRTGSRAT